MVDINLMGEEENREERQPDDSFAQTVNLDLGDTADEDPAAPFVAEPPPSSSSVREAAVAGSAYAGGYSTRPLSMNTPKTGGSSRNTVYLLVAALILAALIAVLLMLSSSKDKDDSGSNITLPPGNSDSSVAITPAPPDSTGSEVNPSIPDASGSTGALDPLFVSTRLGASTVGRLAQSFSGDNDFSLISYAGNNNSFMVQFTSPSNDAVAAATQAMQGSVSPQEFRTVSNQPAGNGSAMNNVMVIGRVGELASSRVSGSAGMMGGGQRRMSFQEFSAWLKKLATDNGLSAIPFQAGQSSLGDGGSRMPVQANFSGSRAGVCDFLNGLADAGPNIALSKIILSAAADSPTPSSARLNMVLLFDFIE